MRDPASPEASTFTKVTADKPADKLGEFAADHGLSEAVRLSATGKKTFVSIRVHSWFRQYRFRVSIGRPSVLIKICRSGNGAPAPPDIGSVDPRKRSLKNASGMIYYAVILSKRLDHRSEKKLVKIPERSIG